MKQNPLLTERKIEESNFEVVVSIKRIHDGSNSVAVGYSVKKFPTYADAFVFAETLAQHGKE